MDIETRLTNMTFYASNLNYLLSVIREDDYLIIEHEDYGHVTELHPDDYPHYREILKDALEFASNKELPPWE